MSHPNINHVVLIGRLTHDPELRQTASGQSVCNLRLACNGIRRDADGEYHERPNFFDVATFAGLAETVARYSAGATSSRSPGAWSGGSGRPPSRSAARRSAWWPTPSSSWSAPGARGEGEPGASRTGTASGSSWGPVPARSTSSSEDRRVTPSATVEVRAAVAPRPLGSSSHPHAPRRARAARCV